MHSSITAGEKAATRRLPLMKSDVEKKIDSRVAAAFADIIPGFDTRAGQEILQNAQESVRTLWVGKIYAALPKDRTTTPEYFLDAELEQFLNDAVEECYEQVFLIAQRAKEEFHS
jgi:hypothetical protein